ncbi:hypothetical protein ColLi_08900 [Colletotrichum liriopes]|uniref:Uncharacterized protein n=1 Tax=Colletotrichum liriopes TaxID=708192 RepID=A0AA37GSA2_9PEZI|nr:hypothetical protein ColLi_08900 [Colletotrichum liriopes]
MAKSVPARDFAIGWICALPIELAAAAKMMDETFADLPSQPADTNIYSFGRIGVHNVVTACLPAGQIGTNQPGGWKDALELEGCQMSLNPASPYHLASAAYHLSAPISGLFGGISSIS